MNRHDLAYVSPAAWRTLLRTHAELAEDPTVASWADRDWPLVRRRANPGEWQGVPLGLPLPPSAGKKRLAFLVPAEDIVAVVPSPSMVFASRAAPPSWRPTLLRLGQFAAQQGAEARVFGSLAWQAITGLDYLTGRSDLDFTLHVHRNTQLRPLADELARMEADAPMRLDGELIRGDGCAVNWRELHGGACELLVKTVAGVTLLDTGQFLSGRVPA
ncbi:MAG TPA: malonate decarboxylase holo-[acyl-carrier-protein] synthase [Geminicoccus sp.]|uniref:malonate decarboxylase holo-[acyl-carrier-protein] synthase n=1 Tax=Geminicoccus sp. TaxID=2024832 RepID=UPI002B5E025F|nr:malonate decarboxylase holo-[acyl-carrier-protein] synthase [Geminicoccus sp.]HWL69694.1 malonate decarboxylase holo-[acyl-carrier-protein] synthase [Geminicoccus sp.]